MPEEEKEKNKFIPEKELVSWQAPARYIEKKSRQFFVSLFAMVGLIGFILFLIEGLTPVILLASLTFLYYVLNTVEPEKITYKITNRGFYIQGQKTDWDLVESFWIGKRDGKSILTLMTYSILGKMEILIDETKKEEIKNTLLEYAEERKVMQSSSEKAMKWVSKRMPGN